MSVASGWPRTYWPAWMPQWSRARARAASATATTLSPTSSRRRRAAASGNQGGSGFGQLALRRLLSAPAHASDCPELRPASANQPLVPRWPAIPAVFSTQALRASGKWHSELAASLAGCAIEPDGVRVLRGPQLSATCVALAPDESASYCGAKGGSLWRWDLATGVRSQLKTPTSNGGSNRDVLAVACSPDGRLLASAGRSAAVVIWDCRTLAKVMELPGHRDAVTSLAVSRSSSAADPNPELFSASADRCVKVWNFQRRQP